MTKRWAGGGRLLLGLTLDTPSTTRTESVRTTRTPLLIGQGDDAYRSDGRDGGGGCRSAGRSEGGADRPTSGKGKWAILH